MKAALFLRNIRHLALLSNHWEVENHWVENHCNKPPLSFIPHCLLHLIPRKKIFNRRNKFSILPWNHVRLGHKISLFLLYNRRHFVLLYCVHTFQIRFWFSGPFHSFNTASLTVLLYLWLICFDDSILLQRRRFSSGRLLIRIKYEI